MNLNILGIYLVDYKNFEDYSIKKLYIDNKDLETFSNKIKRPSQKRLPLFDSLSENIFSTSPRFKIEELNESNYLYFLKEFYNTILKVDDEDILLNSLEDLFGKQNTFQPNIIVYKLDEVHEEKKKKCMYINTFKKNMLMEDKTFLFGLKKKKDMELGVHEIGVLDERNIFILPEKDFVCSIEDDGDITSLKVYKAMELDKLFNVESLINDYAEKKILRFVSDDSERKFKITRNNADVLFEDLDGNDRTDEVVKEIITSDDIHLKKTYASFSGRSTKTVQRILLKRLSEVIESLKAYILDPQTDNLFTEMELPRISMRKREVYVDEKSVKIFAAMLNNEIIQKLLDGTIEIPYYQED